VDWFVDRSLHFKLGGNTMIPCPFAVTGTCPSIGEACFSLSSSLRSECEMYASRNPSFQVLDVIGNTDAQHKIRTPHWQTVINNVGKGPFEELIIMEYRDRCASSVLFNVTVLQHSIEKHKNLSCPDTLLAHVAA